MTINANNFKTYIQEEEESIKLITEAVSQRCSIKKVFLEISQNCRPQVCNIIKEETLAQVFSCEFGEISKNTLFYRTPLVAASMIIFQYKYSESE